MIWIKENGDLILLHPHQVASIEITMLKVSFSIVRMRPSHNICMREVRSGIKLPALGTETDPVQGPTGSCFQLRDGSGSGIGKNFGFGFGYGSGSGISTAFLSIGYYRVLKILIGYFPDKVLSFGSTKVLAALEPLDPSTRLARIYVGFNAILGCCSRRAEQIKEAAQKSD